MSSARVPRALLAALVAVLVAVTGTGCARDLGSGDSADAATTTTRTDDSADAAPSASAEDDGHYQPTDADFAAIRAAAAKRSTAVMRDDRTAFLSVVDRSDELRKQQRVLFANLTRLPLASYAVRVAPTYLPPEGVHGDEIALRPLALERLQVRGVDDRPASYWVDLTWVKRGDRWLLASETGADTTSRRQAGASRAWFGDPVTVATRGDTVVVVDRKDRAEAPVLLDRLRADIDSDADLLGVPSAYDVLVDATTNGGATTMNTVDDEEAGAVYYSAPAFTIDDEHAGAAGSRIKINPKQIDRLRDDDHLLRHEVTHFLMSGRDPRAPTWVSEGLAEYVGYAPRTPRDFVFYADAYRGFRQQASDGPPISGTFGLDPSVDYGLSWFTVTMLVDRSGMSAFLNFVGDFEDSTRVDGDDLVNELLRRHYGITETQLHRELAAYVEELRHQ
jgi:hypothetical protein